MKSLFKLVACCIFLAVSLSANAAVISVLTEDFEGDLSNWTGKSGGATTGQIVLDPLDSSNNVLNFSGVVAGGDIFSIDTVATTSKYTLSFDYMGTGTNGGGDGFLGISLGLPGVHTWLFGNNYPGVSELIDDGIWRTYSTTFATPYSGDSVHIMIEDFRAAAENSYFDNLLLADTSVVPEPSILVLFGAGLLSLGFVRRRKIGQS